MIYDINDKDVYLSRFKENNLNLFWIGYLLYALSYNLSATIVYIDIKQLQAIQFLGIALFTYASINILRFKFKSSYLRVVFILYLLSQFGVIFRGFIFDFFYVKEQLFDIGYGLFIYLAPLFLLFPQNFTYYRKLFLVIIIQSGAYLLFSAVFIKDLFNPDRQSTLSQGIAENFTALGFSVAFVLFTYIYHSSKRRMWALGLMAISVLVVVYRARRGWIFMHITTLLSILMIYLIVSKRTILVTYLAILMTLVGYFYYTNLYNQSNFGIFNFLVERGDEDTRTGVEVLFYEDMSITDWIIGKGINGEYYCPNIDLLDTRGYRNVIETGYLQIILKGGIVSLVLLLLILIPSVIQGLFKSKNIFCKAFGLWTLLWIIYLYPTVGNTFTMQYILVWFGVGVCYSKKIRNMTDEQIAGYLAPVKKSFSRKSNHNEETA